MKHRTLCVSFLFFLGLGFIIFLLIWTNPIERRRFEFEGKGTCLSPYKISSVEDLEKFRDLVNGGEGFLHVFFEQTNDLDLAEIENWVPIGCYGENQYFYGIYDGDGHTISNLMCVGNRNNGLFGVLGGEVRNLGIESGYIEGACVGSITSHGLISASIINCYNKATVNGVERAGGIADNMGGGTIQSCWNLGEISADTGINYGISSYDAVIRNCYCVNLSPAPEMRCKVSNSRTFSLEELEDIKMSNLYEGIGGKIKLIKTNSQTVMFLQENENSKIITWLKTYWILFLLLICSVLFNFIARKYKRKNKYMNSEEEELSFEKNNLCFRGNHRQNRILYTVIFLIVFFCGFALINQILVLKMDTGVVTMQNYYKQPEESIDVLLLGSSRVGMSLDLETLWKYYGISSYACWGGRQPFWDSYYFLKEATNAQKPKVVALEVGAAALAFEYLDDGHQYGNTYGIKGLLNKIQAVQLSAPQKKWNDLIFGLPVYHARYNELTQDDFTNFFWNTDRINYKGNSVRYGVGAYSLMDVSQITETKKIQSKGESYFRKIIEYCQNEEIPLVLFAMPHPSRTTEQPYYNAVQEIADEYKVPFINFNLLDKETGFTAEDFWTDGHLNTSGGRKISSYLGNYLMSNYMLLDHRGDENYKSWDVFSNSMENNYLKLITEADDYFSEIARNGWTAIIVKQNIPENSEAYHSFLLETADTGLSLSFLTEEKKCCYMVNSLTSQQYDHTQECHLRIDDRNMAIDFMYSGTVLIDGEEIYILPKEGIVCMVYDPFSKDIVDIAVFSEEMQYKVIHQ